MSEWPELDPLSEWPELDPDLQAESREEMDIAEVKDTADVLRSPDEEQNSEQNEPVQKSPSQAAINTLPEHDFDLKEHMANLEYSLIQQALKESDGVVAHAAKRLNMRRTTLVEKLRKYEAMFSS